MIHPDLIHPKSKMRQITEGSIRASRSDQLPGVLEAAPRLPSDACCPPDQPRRSPNPEPPTHYELPWVVPGAHFLDLQNRERSRRRLVSLRHRAAGGRLWHGFAVLTAACMAARGRRSKRREDAGEAVGVRCGQPACRGNVRARDRTRSAVAFAGGRGPCLRAFPPRGLSRDCAGGAAGRAVVQPAAGSACRAGAMGRRADGRAGRFRATDAALARCRERGQPAGVAR